MVASSLLYYLVWRFQIYWRVIPPMYKYVAKRLLHFNVGYLNQYYYYNQQHLASAELCATSKYEVVGYLIYKQIRYICTTSTSTRSQKLEVPRQNCTSTLFLNSYFYESLFNISRLITRISYSVTVTVPHLISLSFLFLLSINISFYFQFI